jgi:hypothetical protein
VVDALTPVAGGRCCMRERRAVIACWGPPAGASQGLISPIRVGCAGRVQPSFIGTAQAMHSLRKVWLS